MGMPERSAANRSSELLCCTATRMLITTIITAAPAVNSRNRRKMLEPGSLRVGMVSGVEGPNEVRAE